MTFRYAFCFVFDEHGKVLVLKRADFMRKRPREWDLPGGKIDEGEEQDAGIRREIFEETGLIVKDVELVIRRGGDWQGEHHEFSYYRSVVSNGQILLSVEHTAFEWHEPLVAATIITFTPHLMGLEYELSNASRQKST